MTTEKRIRISLTDADIRAAVAAYVLAAGVTIDPRFIEFQATGEDVPRVCARIDVDMPSEPTNPESRIQRAGRRHQMRFREDSGGAAEYPVSIRATFAEGVVYSLSGGYNELEVGAICVSEAAAAGVRRKIDAALTASDADGNIPDLHLRLTDD